METNNSKSTIGRGEARREGESSVKRQADVTMEMDVFDCTVCFEPLRPPILQCCVGHFICASCHDKLPLKKCHMCSRTGPFKRCYGMESVVDSIVVPCSYAEHGCTMKIAYYEKKGHEKVCPHAPCFCPDSACGFSGTTAALLDHFTTHHKWPSTTFRYHEPFDLRAQPGLHVLRAVDGHLFLLNTSSPEPLGHAISLVCVQAEATESKFRCSVCFSCFNGHSQVSKFDVISSSVSDGPPMDYYCVVRKVSNGHTDVVLSTTIDTELVHEEDDELEGDIFRALFFSSRAPLAEQPYSN